MTTIICDGKTLYADSRAYSGDKTPIGTKHKLHRWEEGIFGGASVKPGAPERVFAHLKEHGVHAHMSEPLDVEALYLCNDGTLYFYSYGNGWTVLDNSLTVAIGSGAQYAYGAMAAGATPEGALEIAINLDVWSDFPIRKLSIE